MNDPASRCRARSVANAESLHGTASTVRRWVLLEEPGPWGAEALRDSRLDAALTKRLDERCRELRLRVVLIRRVSRERTDQRQCFLARTDPGSERVEQVSLDEPGHVLDLDLDAFADRGSAGHTPVSHPLYLVCTQGRHDPCCAEHGRPVVRALAARFAEWTWEVSHIGGDRFAGNMLVLPHGLYYGRVSPEAAPGIAEAYARGEIDAAHLRGRSGYGFPVQAAECLLRKETGIRAVDGLPLVESHRDGDETEAVFAAGDGRYRVRVRTTAAPEERTLTCAATRASAPAEHRLVDLRHESP